MGFTVTIRQWPTPIAVETGQTVLDAARLVHRDFAENLKFAWLYRRPGGASGGRALAPHRMVERTHVVEDGDILELHM